MRKVKSTHKVPSDDVCLCSLPCLAFIATYRSTRLCHFHLPPSTHQWFTAHRPMPISLHTILEIMHLKCLVIWWSHKNTVFCTFIFRLHFDRIEPGARGPMSTHDADHFELARTRISSFVFQRTISNAKVIKLLLLWKCKAAAPPNHSSNFVPFLL